MGQARVRGTVAAVSNSTAPPQEDGSSMEWSASEPAPAVAPDIQMVNYDKYFLILDKIFSAGYSRVSRYLDFITEYTGIEFQ